MFKLLIIWLVWIFVNYIRLSIQEKKLYSEMKELLARIKELEGEEIDKRV